MEAIEKREKMKQRIEEHLIQIDNLFTDEAKIKVEFRP